MSKKKLTLEDIDKGGMLLYKVIRGSHAYGLDTPDSDVDTAAVYFAPKEQIYGLGINYQDQVNDEKNDNVCYELKKFMSLLCKSNPTMLELLFVPDRCVVYEHPIFAEFRKNRDKFVTQLCFNSFGSYARSQIMKAQGLHKMCVQPIIKRQEPLDFAYTPYRQGSTKITNWLDHRHLKQQFCGLVNIPNMDQYMGVFYDWGNHFKYLAEEEYITLDTLVKMFGKLGGVENESSGYLGKLLHEAEEKEVVDQELVNDLYRRLHTAQLYNMLQFISDFYGVKTTEDFIDWYKVQKPIGYKGMVGMDGQSNELKLSSVVENEIPICHMQYNKNAYQQHCRKYKEQEEWKRNRNEKRYESNKSKTWDSKNVMHCFRLITMCIEIAKGEGIKCDRTNIDREELLKIKSHGYEYDEVMEILHKKCEEMNEAIKHTTIPKNIDIDFVNEQTIKLYHDLYGD